MSEREEHDVAITVFCRTRGVDARDAARGAEMALRDVLGVPGVIEGRVHWGTIPVVVADVIETGMAGGNGYLWAQPTSKAFREYKLPELPPEQRVDRVLGAEQDGETPC